MIVMAPFWRPEMPKPATARPPTSMALEADNPQMRDPRVKRNKKDIKVR
jgi:hypothetical protein